LASSFSVGFDSTDFLPLYFQEKEVNYVSSFVEIREKDVFV